MELSSPFALLQRDDARRLVAVGVVAVARTSDVPPFPYIILYGSELPLGGTTRTTRPTRQQDYRLMVVVSLLTPHTHYYHRTNWITWGSAGLWTELSPSHPLNNTLHTCTLQKNDTCLYLMITKTILKNTETLQKLEKPQKNDTYLTFEVTHGRFLWPLARGTSLSTIRLGSLGLW